jgi:3-phosphoshikimate 1-carboxyvinyltransferase
MQVADEIEIVPITHPLAATVKVPGSKSITNRALLLAAMTTGRSTIDAALISDDTRRMVAALGALGFAVEAEDRARRITVEGGAGAIPSTAANLDAGGAGTAMRFLAGFLTLGRGRYRLDGNARMRERPIGALLDAMHTLRLDVLGAANASAVVARWSDPHRVGRHGASLHRDDAAAHERLGRRQHAHRRPR